MENNNDDRADQKASFRRSGIVTGQRASYKHEFARVLRRRMTPQETTVWEKLRAGRLNRLHFRRQQVIDGFIVDFFCLAAGLIIEIDGAVHVDQAEADERRDDVLRR